MNRRDWLQKLPLGAAALVLGGCAAVRSAAPALPAAVEPLKIDPLPKGSRGEIVVQVDGKLYTSNHITIQNGPFPNDFALASSAEYKAGWGLTTKPIGVT